MYSSHSDLIWIPVLNLYELVDFLVLVTQISFCVFSSKRGRMREVIP